MRKLMAVLLAMGMLLSLAACGAEPAEETTEAATEAPAVQTTEQTETAAETSDQELTTVKVAYMPNWGSLWALATADQKGYFAEEGLKLDLIQVEEGTTEVAALKTQGIDVGYIGQGPHKLCSTGVAQVFLLQHVGQADFILGLKGAEEIQDLRGKKVGYAPGTASETLLTAALESAGMTMEDIEALALEAVSLTAAGISEDLDAVSVWNPFAENILAENEKAVKICSNEDFQSIFAPGSWVVDPDWARENKDILVRFTRAMYRGMDYAADAGYKNDLADEVAGYVAKVIKTEPEAILNQRFDGGWLTSDQILVGIENGEILKHYGIQQQGFIKSGVLEEGSLLTPEEFVLTDVMLEAGK